MPSINADVIPVTVVFQYEHTPVFSYLRGIAFNEPGIENKASS
jgi:hypothetical protein